MKNMKHIESPRLLKMMVEMNQEFDDKFIMGNPVFLYIVKFSEINYLFIRPKEKANKTKIHHSL